jgi:hypothetical protein
MKTDSRLLLRDWSEARLLPVLEVDAACRSLDAFAFEFLQDGEFVPAQHRSAPSLKRTLYAC